MAGSTQGASNAGVVVAVVGPTASGKTSLAIRLAQSFSTDVVSADARQVYQSMPIGTAAPTAEECAQATHHLTEFLPPSTLYSAGAFEQDAVPLLDQLCETRGSAILCGGSGMYVKAALEGLDPLPADLAIRNTLNARLKSEGLAPLVEELAALDPVHCGTMDTQNPQRVIRALEVCLTSGKPFSSFHQGQPKARNWRAIQVGLRPERSWLRERIALRANAMMKAGWLDEARALLPHEGQNALNTVGYKELLAHLKGELSLDEAVELLITHTRQFAKRQLTWFQKDPHVQWFDFNESTQTDSLNEAHDWVLNACKDMRP